MIDVVLPVLNEADAIPWVLTRLPAGYRPIVVDNGSSDGSGDLAREHGARVIEEHARGFGAACFAGLTASSSSIVCFMDCDGSLDPADLPRIVTPIDTDEADLVLGARIPEPGAWPLHARLANRILADTVSRRTGVRLTDIGPMRAMQRDQLVRLDLRDRRSGWPLEMVLRATDAGYRILELPVPYRRRTGRSKVTGTIKGTAQAVRDMRAQLA